MVKSHLNFARALRPKDFGNVFGQDIPIRMLCNGLALGRLFPTYIFSGQRGCGKTTSARIFAGALNCTNLDQALKSRLLEIPCNSCNSCQMFLAANHPDFVEIDAASHTGVDNVRQILEAATYLPVVGKKKIYLIDEAHMLSKSAFNAFLKMLEEPPESAIFLLATTELSKIPDTVRSRAFHAIFKPIDQDKMVDFLSKICLEQKIDLSVDVLKIIAKQSEGSLRDALNLVEQLHWACMGQDCAAQLEIASNLFGLVSSDLIFEIGQLVFTSKLSELAQRLSAGCFAGKRPEVIWREFGGFLAKLLRAKVGALDSGELNDKIIDLSRGCSLEAIKSLSLFFWDNEDSFLRTSHKKLFLEHILTQMTGPGVKNLKVEKVSSHHKNGLEAEQSPKLAPNITKEIKSTAPEVELVSTNNLPEAWLNFVSVSAVKADRLLESILKQVCRVEEISDGKVLELSIVGLNNFFSSKINDSKGLILKEIVTFYQNVSEIRLKAAQASKPGPSEKKIVFEPKPVQNIDKERLPSIAQSNFANKNQSSNYAKKTSFVPLDISDKEKWPKSNLLIKLFAGRVEDITNK